MKGSDIQNLDFNINFLGYKKSDVKACLREISEYVMKLENKIYKLEVERDRLKDKLNKNEIGQSNFKDIIVSAQEFRKKIEFEAKEKAVEIITQAKKEHAGILKSIREEQQKLNIIKQEVENVKNSILDKLERFRSVVESKQKNIQINEEILEKESNSFYDNDRVVKIDKDEDSENKKMESKTLEFSTNSDLPTDENYIRSKFKEIELR